MMCKTKIQRFILVVGMVFVSMIAACGTDQPAPDDAPPTDTLTAEEAQGFQVYTRYCAACHLLTENDIKVGPSLHGIAETAGSRVPGQDVETYLYTSVLKPDAYLVEGFENVMPQGLAKSLTSEELDAVVAYLLTLK